MRWKTWKKYVCLFVCHHVIGFCDAHTNPLFHSQKRVPQPLFPDPITRSLLLAISVCYHARLRDREDYEEGVSAQFVAPLGLPEGAAQFRKEIQWYTLASSPCRRIFVLTTVLPPQLPGSATGQYDPGAQHRQECCSPRECLYDGNLHRIAYTPLPCWQTWKLQVSRKVHCAGLNARHCL